MEIKRNKSTKVIVIAIAILLCLALAVGITGAFYQAQRRATGTVKMDKGIVIDYTGFGKTPNEGTWLRETTISFKLFEDADVQPGEKVSLNDAGIKANTASVDFYARLKLDYEFYNGETKLETLPASFNASDLITTSATFFGSNWVKSNDGYHYYATGTTLNKFTSSAPADFVDLFDTNAQFIIEGAGFTGAYPDGEGGGFVIDETTSINKIVVYLTLETLQGDANPTDEGWKIIEEQDSMELTSTDYIIKTTTNEETSEEITIYTPNDDYVLANPEYAFKFTIDDTAKTAMITGPVGAPTSLTIPSKILLDGQNYDVIAIGPVAFMECASLTSITLPRSLESIGVFAFAFTGLTSITIPDNTTSIENYALSYCTGLTSITVESGNAKYHSEENCLIETASKTLIAGCKNSIIPTDGSVTSIGDMAFICSGLTSITIPDSVTSIGNYAFHGCSGLTSITISDSVTSFGEEAFSACTGLAEIIIPSKLSITFRDSEDYTSLILTALSSSKGNNIVDRAFENYTNLTSITISDGISSIGWGAFYGCSGLTEVVIGNQTTSIGVGAFADCSGLTSITIPSSVTSIGNNAFNGCSGLTSITVASGNTKYHSEGNCLIETASKTLILGCKNSIIPTDGSVTSIGEFAFYYCSGLISITIPSSLTSIGYYAFYGCSGLTSITIPESVTSIGNYAFSGCSSLIEITIPSSAISVGYRAFYECDSLQASITEDGISYLGNEANKCIVAWKVADNTLSSYTIKDGCKFIYDECFIRCSSATEITIPNSVISIGTYAFSSCSRLTSITIPNGVTSIEDWTFKSCSSLTSIIIPDSVTSIGGSAFSSCSGLTSITIPNSVTSIGSGAFYGCNNLQARITEDGISYLGNATNKYIVAWKVADNTLSSYTIKDGCKFIYEECFINRSSATEITIPNSVISIGEKAFYGCSGLTSITIPSSVTSIGDYAFESTGLTEITIPSSVTSIGNWAFSDCSGLTSITVASGNTKYHSEGNCLIETANKTLILGCKNSIIPTDGSVTSIGGYAFDGCTGLTEITIPSSVTSIENNAFRDCSGLTSITVASGNTKYHSEGNCLIETASKTLILGCKNSIIPTDGSVTSIGNDAFDGCTGLTEITIPSGVTSIGDGAFWSCNNLTTITIPDSVTSIGADAFLGCNNLATVIIDSSTIAVFVDYYSKLITNATRVYVKTGLTVGSYITDSFTKQESSDKAGYDMYTKNS